MRELRSTGGVLVLCGAAFFSLHFLRVNFAPGYLLSTLLSNEPSPVVARGVVLEEPELRSTGKLGERSRFQVHLEQITIRGATYRLPAPVLVDWRGKTPSRGDLIELTAEAHNLAPPRNPGQFNQPRYLNRLGVFSEFRVRYPSDGKVISSGHGNPILGWADASRAWMQKKLTSDLEDCPEVSGLIQSLVLGIKEATPEETRELFQKTGTMHLFVVNGLHIGLFAAIVWSFLKPLSVTRRRAVFVVIPLIAFYAMVTGASPGSLRATIMASIMIGSHLVERKPIAMNSLAAAGVVILLGDTNELFRPGFQFSFGVVTAILLFATSLRALFARFGQPDPFLPRLLWSRWQVAIAGMGRHLSALAAVSIAAWLGSLPFTMGYFHLLSVSAVLANLVLVPTAFIILGQGLLSICGGSISATVGAVFTNANWAAVKFLLIVVRGFALLPGSHVYLELPHFGNPETEITVFDFGRGNAVHVRTQGHDWLLDTGSRSNFDNILRPYLRSRGINQLDGLLVSHGHTANMGGALAAVDEFHPKQIIDSPLRDRSGARKAFQEGLGQRSISKTTISRGDVIQLSNETTLRILFPPLGFEGRTADTRSLVVMMETSGKKILFQFDTGYPTEEWLLENEPDLKCDILIKGMHADEPSGTPAFLAATNPRVIVCGTGGDAGFSRITDEWAATITKAVLFRQDRTGAVMIELKDHSFTARGFIGGRSSRDAGSGG